MKMCSCDITIKGTREMIADGTHPAFRHRYFKKEDLERKSTIRHLERGSSAGPLVGTHTRKLAGWAIVREYVIRQAAEHAANCSEGSGLVPYLRLVLARSKAAQKSPRAGSWRTPSNQPAWTTVRVCRRLAEKYGAYGFALECARMETASVREMLEDRLNYQAKNWTKSHDRIRDLERENDTLLRRILDAGLTP